MKHSRQLIIAIGFVISIAFLILSFRDLQFDKFMESIQTANFLIVGIAAVTYFLAVVVISWRWQFLIRGFQYIRLNGLFSIVCIGYMGNNVYPLRAGEALRVLLLKKDYDVGIAKGATTVVIERVFDGLVMITFILIPLVLLDIESSLIRSVALVTTPLFITAMIIFFILAARPNILNAIVRAIVRFLPSNIGTKIQHIGDDIIVGLEGLRTPAQLLGAIFASFLAWGIEAFVYWLMLIAFQLDLGYLVAFLIVGTVNLSGLIPASPGNVGVYEFFASSILILFGVPAATATAYAVVTHIVIWLPVTLVGFLFLIREGWGWADIRRASDIDVPHNNTSQIQQITQYAE